MKKAVLTLVTAAAIGTTALMAPSPAHAWRGGWGWGPGLAGGLIAGAVIGGIASSAYAYGPGYGYYGGPGYGYYGGYGPAYYGGGYAPAYGGFQSKTIATTGMNYEFGGGFDWRIKPHWSVRLIEADYMISSFKASSLSDPRQTGFRISAGIVYLRGQK